MNNIKILMLLLIPINCYTQYRKKSNIKLPNEAININTMHPDLSCGIAYGEIIVFFNTQKSLEFNNNKLANNNEDDFHSENQASIYKTIRDRGYSQKRATLASKDISTLKKIDVDAIYQLVHPSPNKNIR